jgi:hypothetical protein
VSTVFGSTKRIAALCVGNLDPPRWSVGIGASIPAVVARLAAFATSDDTRVGQQFHPLKQRQASGVDRRNWTDRLATARAQERDQQN